ncbi:MAG: hypothetical protein JNM93_02920 [Bacteriovoracaceae bacterium]|nr:hypothetical protein [Bacteriovoracaceae bacterium]
MSKKYFFAITNIGNEKLLKTEMEFRYPSWKFAYSRPGFLTYVGPENDDFPTELMMARVWGESKGKVKEFPKNFKGFFLKLDESWDWPTTYVIKQSQINLGSQPLMVLVAPDEVWQGELVPQAYSLGTVGEVGLSEDFQAPSRAYLKMLEAAKAFALDLKAADKVLELGSAPGGITTYLLNQQLEVWGVDKAEMDASVLANKKYHHLNNSLEKLTEREYPKDVAWVVSDINLPFKVVMKHLTPHIQKLTKLKGAVITAKIEKPTQLKEVLKIKHELGVKFKAKVLIKHLPSHRQETALLLLFK